MRGPMRVRAAVIASVVATALAADLPAAAVSPAPSKAATTGTSLRALPQAPARGLFVRVCTMCHAAEIVTAKRHTPQEWDDLIARMVDHGAMATDEEQERIFEYLVRFYGTGSRMGGNPASDGASRGKAAGGRQR